MATTPMTAISSMSAPVNANPLDDCGAVLTVDAAVVAGDPPSDGVAAGVVVMPVVGVVHPV
jgi:uncharacterized membrane protein